MHIKIDHIAKIEGHAGFMAQISDGRATEARLDIMEGARLLEGILRDRGISEVSQITSRICGVCPVVHVLTSLKALEKALGVSVSEQTLWLRRLMMLGQIINSHALHLFFFSLSDFFGVADDLKLVQKFPDKAKDALAVREFGNQLIEIIGGRSIHPVTPQIGGFTKLPDMKKLSLLFSRVDDILAAAERLAKLFVGLKYPDFIRSAPFVSLSHAAEYAIYDGLVKMPAEKEMSVDNFLALVQERQIGDSVVKHADLGGEKFMVGALSRINNNFHQLNPAAKKLLVASKMSQPNFNPFFNTLAQAIETVHCLEEVKKITRQALRKSLLPANADYKIKAGRGAAAIEAPRGTLYYFYELGSDGLVKECNIITPTAQNIARLEKDLEKYLEEMAAGRLSKNDQREKIKMLVRAYDPCLTCATH